MKSTSSSSIQEIRVALLSSENKSETTIFETLSAAGCDVVSSPSVETLFDEFQGAPADLICIESRLCGDFDAFRKEEPAAMKTLANEVIIFSSRGGTEEAIEWARVLQGYVVTLPIVPEELTVLVERAMDTGMLRKRLARYESTELQLERFGSMVVQSPEMKDVIRLARILADRDDHLLFFGGVGTGKEQLARTIHENSSRASGHFFSMNCRSQSVEELAEELFGLDENFSEEEGGTNILSLVDGGSLFLDEWGVLTEELQNRLLRLITQKTYTTMDSRTSRSCDVRVFAATSLPLDEMVAKGEFSEDLYFRISRFSLHLPSLRRRSEDIPILVRQILGRISADRGESAITLTEETLQLLVDYSWPGNLRELENVLDFASLVAGDGPIEPSHLPRQFQDDIGSLFVGTHVEDLPPMSEIERRYIVKVMEATNGNKVRAANILDINRATLHRKLQIYAANKRAEVG